MKKNPFYVYSVRVLTAVLIISMSFFILACKPDRGEQGIPGPQGEQGTTGPQGEQGAPYIPPSEGLTHALPVVEINTQNNDLPVNKVDYVNSSFKLHSTVNDNVYGIDVAMTEQYGDSNSVGIRLRGNSTRTYPKKPYRIKFDKKQSVFGSPANKNWVLLADYLDPSLMKNYTAFKLAAIFDNMPWVPQGTHVNLYLNGEYKGVYLLCDQIDEKSGRLNLETENDYTAGQSEYPFLVEISHDVLLDDSTDINDTFHVTNFVTEPLSYPQGSPAEIKYPENGDGRTADATEYISGYVNAAFTALNNADYDTFCEYVDIDSYIDFILINDILYNNDSHWKSIYVSKKVGEKLKFGPIWDFDGAGGWTGNPDDSAGWGSTFNTLSYTNSGIAGYEFGEAFYNKVAQRFNSKIIEVNVLYGTLFAYKEYLRTDGVNNTKLWYTSDLYNKNYDAFMLFLSKRYNFMSQLFVGDYNQFVALTT